MEIFADADARIGLQALLCSNKIQAYHHRFITRIETTCLNEQCACFITLLKVNGVFVLIPFVQTHLDIRHGGTPNLATGFHMTAERFNGKPTVVVRVRLCSVDSIAGREVRETQRHLFQNHLVFIAGYIRLDRCFRIENPNLHRVGLQSGLVCIGKSDFLLRHFDRCGAL